MRRALMIGAALVATVGIVVGSLWGGMEGSDVLWPVTWIVWAPVGALILLRRPGNGVGVSMLVTGLLWGLGFLFLAVAESEAPLAVRVWAELVTVASGVVSWLGIIWLILVFPSGRVEGWLARATAIGFILFGTVGVLAFTVSTGPMETTGVPSPLATAGLSEMLAWVVGEDGFYVIIGLVGLAVVSAATRWYRSDGVERHQYRWLLLGALVFVATLALGQVLPEDSAGLYMWLLAGAAIPLSVGVAIIRYRLYEIDRIVSRTVTYALVVGLLVGAVALVAALVGTRSEDPLVVAATTLGVAALFNPLRIRIQKLVDRRFNRSRYDAERVMDGFARSLRDVIDPDAVAEGWSEVVTDTMEPTVVGLWVSDNR